MFFKKKYEKYDQGPLKLLYVGITCHYSMFWIIVMA